MSDQLAAMEQATAFKQAGFDELANQTLAKYGLDSTMLDAWQGMSDTTKEQMAALLQGASLASSGNDTGAKSYLQMAGIDPGSTDYYSTIAGRQNASALALARQKSAITGTGRSRGRSGSSSSKTGSSGYGGLQYSSSNVTSMMNKLAGMSQNDPMYSIILGELRKAGVDVDGEPGTGITTKRMQVAANAAQGQQSRGSDEQTIYNSLRLQGYSEDEIAYAMGTLK